MFNASAIHTALADPELTNGPIGHYNATDSDRGYRREPPGST